jgi:hypothetical protein
MAYYFKEAQEACLKECVTFSLVQLTVQELDEEFRGHLGMVCRDESRNIDQDYRWCPKAKRSIFIFLAPC